MAALSGSLGRPIVRRHGGPIPTDTLDVAALASVDVTSEHELFPIDNVFDGRQGSGGSCWAARQPGVQTVLLRFHAPTDLERLTIESEECGGTCSQDIDVSGYSAHREKTFEAPRRVLNYSPYGPSFHRETWILSERGVTHVWIRIAPSPLGRFASLTSITFR
ncbi:MAG TPA: hypothetical protein VIF62_37415 [Labilithrix sp.]|jgi:hypothetical protein